MMHPTKEPLPPYKQPIFYFGLLTLMGLVLFILSLIDIENSPELFFSSFIIISLFGLLTFFSWITRCPHCKISLYRKENLLWRDDLGIKKEPFTYYSKVYKYSDGFTENVPGSEKTIMRSKQYNKHYYVCKRCNYGEYKNWNKIKSFWIGDVPKPKYILKKEKFFKIGNNKEQNENMKKRRIPLQSRLKKEIYLRANNACQHCGHKFGLEIHHIDENPSNNSKTNLILLCANCHKMVYSISKFALKNECTKCYKN